RRTKRWTDPVGWQEHLRNDSVEVPGTRVLGPAPTDVFCGVTTWGSVVLMRMTNQPRYVFGVLLLPLALTGFLLYLAWTTIVAALRVYLRYLPVFAVIGLLVIPIGILSSRVYDLAIRYTAFRDFV